MADDFSFKWELIDQVSRNATAIQRALEKAEGAMKHAQGAARGGSSSWALMGIKMGSVVGIASELTRTLLNVGEGAVRLGVSGAKYAIESASFRENSLIALEAIMGSRQAALQALDAWSALSEKTPFDNRKVQEWGKQLTIAGESLGNTVTILKGVADVGTIMGNTADEQERFAAGMVDAISNIKQMGSVSERHLRVFREMGISPQKIMANMAARLTGGNIPALKKVMESGQDVSHEAVLAILQTIQDTYGKLGGLGKKGSETLSGLLTKIDFDDLFKGLETSKGYNALKSILRNIRDLLDPSTASGKVIHDSMMDLSNALGTALAPLTGKEGRANMAAFFKGMVDGIKEVLPWAERAGTAMKWVWLLSTGHAGEAIGKDIAGALGGGGPTAGPTLTVPSNSAVGSFFGHTPGESASSYLGRSLAAFPHAAPSLTVNTTVHVHGNADTDNLVEKIDTQTQESFTAYLERVALFSWGAQ